MTTVRVFLNENAFDRERPFSADGFQRGDKLRLAVQYDTSDVDQYPTYQADVAFHLFNEGDPADLRVHYYRAKGNRSLSVGDVVQVGDVLYTCERIGWRVVACEWFANCERPAIGTRDNPVLGQVPVCAKCAAFVDA